MNAQAVRPVLFELTMVTITVTLAPVGLLFALTGIATGNQLSVWDLATPMLAWIIITGAVAWVIGSIPGAIAGMLFFGIGLSFLEYFTRNPS